MLLQRRANASDRLLARPSALQRLRAKGDVLLQLAQLARVRRSRCCASLQASEAAHGGAPGQQFHLARRHAGTLQHAERQPQPCGYAASPRRSAAARPCRAHRALLFGDVAGDAPLDVLIAHVRLPLLSQPGHENPPAGVCLLPASAETASPGGSACMMLPCCCELSPHLSILLLDVTAIDPRSRPPCPA